MSNSLNLDLESGEKGQDLRLRKFRLFQLVLRRIDVVIGRSDEIRIFEIGVLESAGAQIGIRKVGVRQIRTDKIGFMDRAFEELRSFHFKFVEVA